MKVSRNSVQVECASVSSRNLNRASSLLMWTTSASGRLVNPSRLELTLSNSDNYWLGKETPCLTYGLRGLTYFEVGVQCSSKDLHSGVYGGSTHEAMTDLVHLMGSLVNTKGHITVRPFLNASQQFDHCADSWNL